MKIINRLTDLLIASVLVSVISYAKSVDYNIASGDTLYIIAKKHHTTVKELKEISGLKAGDTLRLGQQIKVPVDTYFPDTSKLNTPPKVLVKNTKQYKIVAGDTLYIVAKKNNTTTSAIREANSMKKGQLIRVGQMLNLPAKQTVKVPAKVSKKAIVYVVTAGDTLYSIAKRNNTSTDNIRKINSMTKKELIRVGQKLKITESKSTSVDKIEKKNAEKSTKMAPAKIRPKSKTPIVKVTPEKVEKSTIIAVGKKSYKVKAGDSLSVIARDHNITTKELQTANGMKTGDSIRVGQTLKMPLLAAANEPKSKPTKVKNSPTVNKNPVVKSNKVDKTHTVKKKDTLYSIAKNNHVSLKKLLDLNGMTGNYSIKVGQKLKLYDTSELSKQKLSTSNNKKKLVQKKTPQKKAAVVRYKVKKGDVISLIAKNNNIDLNKLLKMNKLTKRSKLRIGQMLVLGTDGIAKTTVKNKRTASALKNLNKKKKSKKRSKRYAKKGSNAKVIRTAKRYLGRKYVWGATGPSKFDCSGFTQYVLRKSKGVRIPRVSRQQAYYGKYVSRRNLRAGDLVFFDTSRRRRGYVNHVGIYIGNNQFIHASSARHRVVITSLNRPFYRSRFKWGRRVN